MNVNQNDLAGTATAAELDAFPFFATEDHDMAGATDLFALGGGEVPDEQPSDPLDSLFARPVQEFLMREETPDKATSFDMTTMKPKEQRFASAGRYESLDSVEVPPDLLSDSEEPEEHFELPIIEEEEEEDLHPLSFEETSTKNKRKSTSRKQAIPPPYTGPTLRKRSREVTPIPSSKKELPLPQKPKSSHVAKASNSRREATEHPTKKKKKLRRSQSTAIQASPDYEVNEVHSHDVLFGKGGKINKHEGNLSYHLEKQKLQKEYLDPITSKNRKRELVQILYSIVVHDWGGRFLRRGDEEDEERWYEAHREAALEKCRQALATPQRTKQERAARRRMFIEKRKKRQGTSNKSA